MKKYFFIFVTCFLFIRNVDATSMQVNCPQTALPGDNITCNVIANSSNSISGIEAKIQVSSNLDFIEFIGNESWEDASEAGIIYLYTENNKTGTFQVGTIKAKVNSNANSEQNESILIHSGLFYNDKFQEISVGNTSSTIDILSTNAYLKSLILKDVSLSPTFDKNTFSYTATVEQEQVFIEATPIDNKAKISGIGNHTLIEGNNTIKIIVTSEAGNTQAYTILITRKIKEKPKEEEKNEEPKEEPPKEEPTEQPKEEEKQELPQEQKPEENITNFEKNNTLQENALEKFDLRLNKCIISGYEIGFSSDIFEYQLEVTKEVEYISIDASSFDDKAVITIEGNINLKKGYNKVIIKVTRDDKTLEYIIHVNREQEIDYLLKSLVVEGYDISFSPNIFNYTIIIDKEKSLKINTIANSIDAKVKIIGNEQLKNGSSILINVTKDEVETKYTLNIITKESLKEVEVLVKDNNYTLIFGILSIITFCIFILIKILLKKINNNKLELNIESDNNDINIENYDDDLE